MHKDFSKRVKIIVRSIPKGSVLSYGQVAALAGNPYAYRAVGTIMRNNFDETVPCHRVICSDGTIGGYNRGGTAKKRALLKSEGFIR